LRVRPLSRTDKRTACRQGVLLCLTARTTPRRKR